MPNIEEVETHVACPKCDRRFRNEHALGVHLARAHGGKKWGPRRKKGRKPARLSATKKGRKEQVAAVMTEAQLKEYQQLLRVKAALEKYPCCPGCGTRTDKALALAVTLNES